MADFQAQYGSINDKNVCLLGIYNSQTTASGTKDIIFILKNLELEAKANSKKLSWIVSISGPQVMVFEWFQGVWKCFHIQTVFIFKR